MNDPAKRWNDDVIVQRMTRCQARVRCQVCTEAATDLSWPTGYSTVRPVKPHLPDGSAGRNRKRDRQGVYIAVASFFILVLIRVCLSGDKYSTKTLPSK